MSAAKQLSEAAAADLRNERDELARECDRMRIALREIAELSWTVDYSAPQLEKLLIAARNTARNAIAKIGGRP